MRLRRIRYKDGRAPLHVMHTPQPNGEPGNLENYRGKIMQHARSVSEQDEEGSRLAGFFVVGLFSDGTASVGFRLPPWLSRTLAPSYLADLIRRDGLMDSTARDVFNEMFEWVE